MKRSPMPPRTRPLRSGAWLRRAGLEPGARRGTRPSALTRRLVLERDGYVCVCCGRSVIGRRYSLGRLMGLALAVFLRRLRYLCRLSWYRLTGRWPRYRWTPMDGGRACTSGEAEAFALLMASHKTAPEPEYGKRRQP